MKPVPVGVSAPAGRPVRTPCGSLHRGERAREEDRAEEGGRPGQEPGRLLPAARLG